MSSSLELAGIVTEAERPDKGASKPVTRDASAVRSRLIKAIQPRVCRSACRQGRSLGYWTYVLNCQTLHEFSVGRRDAIGLRFWWTWKMKGHEYLDEYSPELDMIALCKSSTAFTQPSTCCSMPTYTAEHLCEHDWQAEGQDVEGVLPRDAQWSLRPEPSMCCPFSFPGTAL